MIEINATIGQVYGPAMEIETQEEADAYFEQLVERALRQGVKSREAAESRERDNLGYYAGYYSRETAVHVEKLFNCTHPKLGPARLRA